MRKYGSYVVSNLRDPTRRYDDRVYGTKKVQLATKKGIWGTNGFDTLFLLLTTTIFDVRMNETSFFAVSRRSSSKGVRPCPYATGVFPISLGRRYPLTRSCYVFLC